MKKNHLTNNALFLHSTLWKSVADVYVLTKKLAMVNMEQLVNSPTRYFQDFSGVKRSNLEG